MYKCSMRPCVVMCVRAAPSVTPAPSAGQSLNPEH